MSISLEYGKSYVLVDGRETGPLTGDSTVGGFPYYCHELKLSWRADGTQYFGKDYRGPLNISHEVPASDNRRCHLHGMGVEDVGKAIESNKEDSAGFSAPAWEITAGSPTESGVTADASPWHIEAGTYVKLRNGDKAWVVGRNPGVLWVIKKTDGAYLDCHPSGRQYAGSRDHEYDIIGPWVEPPKTERKTVTRWVVVDKDGDPRLSHKSLEAAKETQREFGGEVVELVGTTTREYPV